MSVPHSAERPAKWLAAAVVSFLLIASAAGWFLLTEARRGFTLRQGYDRLAHARNAAEFVDGLLRQSIQEQQSFIERQERELLSADARTVTQLLREFTADSPFVSSGALLVRGGIVLATWPENPAIIGRDLPVQSDHLDSVLRTGRPAVSGVIPSAVFFDKPAIEIASPVRDEGARVEAILSSTFLVDGSVLEDHLKRLDAGPAGYYFVTDGKGELVASSVSLDPDLDPIPEDKVQAHAPVPTAEWTVTARQDRSAAEEPLSGATSKIIPLLLILITALAVMGFLAYRFLRRAAATRFELEGAEQRVASIERERIRDHERLQKLDAEKDEFVSTVSHELRGPLTIIKGWIEMILEGRFGELTEDQHEYLTISKNHVERMFALVEDLLTLSKAESGRLDITPEEMSVSEVISDLAAAVEQIVEERGIQLAVEVEPDLPSIEADRHRIEQVITNFLSNAIKFTPEGGTVWMKARSEDSGIVAEVSDTGVGIPTDEQGDLFKKFFRTSNVKGTVPGTGLGLAISKAIVEQHGGRVGLESVEGEGSTFWMWLPRTFNAIAFQTKPSGDFQRR